MTSKRDFVAEHKKAWEEWGKKWQAEWDELLYHSLTGDWEWLLDWENKNYESRKKSIQESIAYAEEHYVPKYGGLGPHIGLKGRDAFLQDLADLEASHQKSVADLMEKINERTK